MKFDKLFCVVLVSIFSVVKPNTRGESSDGTCDSETCDREFTCEPGHGLEQKTNDEPVPFTATVNGGNYTFAYKSFTIKI